MPGQRVHSPPDRDNGFHSDERSNALLEAPPSQILYVISVLEDFVAQSIRLSPAQDHFVARTSAQRRGSISPRMLTKCAGLVIGRGLGDQLDIELRLATRSSVQGEQSTGCAMAFLRHFPSGWLLIDTASGPVLVRHRGPHDPHRRCSRRLRSRPQARRHSPRVSLPPSLRPCAQRGPVRTRRLPREPVGMGHVDHPHPDDLMLPWDIKPQLEGGRRLLIEDEGQTCAFGVTSLGSGPYAGLLRRRPRDGRTEEDASVIAATRSGAAEGSGHASRCDMDSTRRRSRIRTIAAGILDTGGTGCVPGFSGADPASSDDRLTWEEAAAFDLLMR